MINKKEIKQRLAYMDVGQSVYWPHECHKESRPSLQITREEKGWFAYCHRCHELAFIPLAEFSPVVKQKEKPKKINNLPDCSTKGIWDRTLWPGDMVAFTRMLSQEEIIKYGIEYLPEKGMLKLPVDSDSGCVYRMNNPKRYLSNLKEKQAVFKAGELNNPKLCVLTEDILSAIVIAETALDRNLPVCALAQLTVGVKRETVDFLLDKKPEMCLVWFDNDNPEVRKQQRKVARKVRDELGIPVHIILDYPGIDPKELSRIDIYNILYKYINNN